MRLIPDNKNHIVTKETRPDTRSQLPDTFHSLFIIIIANLYHIYIHIYIYIYVYICDMYIYVYIIQYDII